MFPFCVSMSLSKESSNFLDSIRKFDLSSSDRDSFLHTTILQGVAPSEKVIKEWLSSGMSLLANDGIKQGIAVWDQFIKGIGNSYTVDFNSEYSALCLEYSFSDYIVYLSNLLVNEFMNNHLIYDINNIVEFIKPLSESEIDYNYLKYAFDFQYQSKSYSIKPHTTLGFTKGYLHEKAKVMKLFRQISSNSIRHSSIWLTRLDKFCMTPNIGRYKISDIQLL